MNKRGGEGDLRASEARQRGHKEAGGAGSGIGRLSARRPRMTQCTNEMDVRGEGSASTRTTRRNRPLSRDWQSRSLSKSHIEISVAPAEMLPLKI